MGSDSEDEFKPRGKRTKRSLINDDDDHDDHDDETLAPSRLPRTRSSAKKAPATPENVRSSARMRNASSSSKSRILVLTEDLFTAKDDDEADEDYEPSGAAEDDAESSCVKKYTSSRPTSRAGRSKATESAPPRKGFCPFCQGN